MARLPGDCKNIRGGAPCRRASDSGCRGALRVEPPGAFSNADSKAWNSHKNAPNPPRIRRSESLNCSDMTYIDELCAICAHRNLDAFPR